MNQQQTWMRTDTASIMFSALTTRRWGRTFRFTAELDAPLDPAPLKAAVEDVLPYYPSARTDLRRGFFWTYQRITDAMPQIRAETARPASLHEDVADSVGLDFVKKAVGAVHLPRLRMQS